MSVDEQEVWKAAKEYVAQYDLPSWHAVAFMNGVKWTLRSQDVANIDILTEIYGWSKQIEDGTIPKEVFNDIIDKVKVVLEKQK